MTTTQKLIESYERGLAKMKAANYEEFGQAIANHEAVIAALKNSVRYERLRVIGCAPHDTMHLQKGNVMRFTNLDDHVDAHISRYPSVGEA